MLRDIVKAVRQDLVWEHTDGRTDFMIDRPDSDMASRRTGNLDMVRVRCVASSQASKASCSGGGRRPIPVDVQRSALKKPAGSRPVLHCLTDTALSCARVWSIIVGHVARYRLVVGSPEHSGEAKRNAVLRSRTKV